MMEDDVKDMKPQGREKTFIVPMLSPERKIKKQLDKGDCFVYIHETDVKSDPIKDPEEPRCAEDTNLATLVVSGVDDVHSDTDPPQTQTYVLKIKGSVNHNSKSDTGDSGPQRLNGQDQDSRAECDDDMNSDASTLTASSENSNSCNDSCQNNEDLMDGSTEQTSQDTDQQAENLMHDEETSSKTRRSSRKRSYPLREITSVTCPLCGRLVRTDQLSTHVETELCKLEKMTNDRLLRSRKSYETPCKSVGPVQVPTVSADGDEEIMDSSTRYKSYLTVRTRRERRSLAKKKKKNPGPGEQETKCPVCNESIIGTEDELAEHVDQCLVQQEEDGSAELDVEGDDGGFEEYTWAGQTRIRATSLVEGGLAASGFQTTRCSMTEDDDVDLDVDGDDCQLYGNAQYTEADLLPCRSEEPDEEKERKALRNAVIRGEGSRVSRTVPSDRQRWAQSGSGRGDKRIQKNSEGNGVSCEASSSEVACLKAKIRDQATQLEKLERPKCLICMDWYTTPLVSVQCWHVHCEECWLRTLGTKKLCPQCNMITSPNDLRKIYL